MAVSLEICKETYNQKSYELLGPLLMGYVRQPGKKNCKGRMQDILKMMQEEGAQIITPEPKAEKNEFIDNTLLVDERKNVAVHLSINSYQGYSTLTIFDFKENKVVSLMHSTRGHLDHFQNTTLSITDMRGYTSMEEEFCEIAGDEYPAFNIRKLQLDMTPLA